MHHFFRNRCYSNHGCKINRLNGYRPEQTSADQSIFTVGVEEVHVFIDGDTSLGGGFLNGLFLDLEGEFGLPSISRCPLCARNAISNAISI